MKESEHMSNLEKTALVSGAILPVPIAGELLLGVGFSSLLKDETFPTPLRYAIGISTAALARIQFYDSIYNPMLSSILNSMK